MVCTTSPGFPSAGREKANTLDTFNVRGSPPSIPGSDVNAPGHGFTPRTSRAMLRAGSPIVNGHPQHPRKAA